MLSVAGGNSPIQRQNTSGYTITNITGYRAAQVGWWVVVEVVVVYKLVL